MRIALLHYSCEPCVGGVETILGAHARLFAAHGHQVTVIAGRGGPQPGVAFESLAAGGDPTPRLRILLPALDLVIVHNVLTMPFEPGWTAALWPLAEEFSAVRFLAWVHDLAATNPDYAVAPDSLLQKAHPGFQYIAISEKRRLEFRELTGVDSRVIPNGIDPAAVLGLSSPVAALAAEKALFAQRIVLFHPARLLRRKNVEFSLRVTAAIRAMGAECTLLVTAAPDAHNAASVVYARELRDLRRTLALEDCAVFVHDRFAVTSHDLLSLYAVADALLFPSIQEGFGLPILEGALLRIPVFCSDIAPLNTLVDDPRYCFAPDCPAEQVAMLIVKTLNASKEAKERKRVLRDYAWPTIYDKFLAPLLNQTSSLITS